MDMENPKILPRQHCNQCNASFDSKIALINHLKSIHTFPNLNKTFKCDTEKCEKTFTSDDHLKEHSSTAHKTIASEDNLKKHTEKIQEGNGQFQCITCQYEFPSKENLNSHIATAHNVSIISNFNSIKVMCINPGLS